MTGDRERSGEEIGDVVETADEEDTKVSLADPVSDPMQAHVRCLRHPLGDRVGSNADSHLVVTKQRGGGLEGPCWPRFCVPLSRCGQRRTSRRTSLLYELRRKGFEPDRL
jgi:hypothetical protein